MQGWHPVFKWRCWRTSRRSETAFNPDLYCHLSELINKAGLRFKMFFFVFLSVWKLNNFFLENLVETSL